MLDEQWAASLGSRPASVAAVFGGAVADPHNETLTACQPRVPPKCPERLNPALIPMFFPLLREHSVVSQFHDMTWCFSCTSCFMEQKENGGGVVDFRIKIAW